ncbi:MAG: glutamate-semialdehyde -aminomutase [Gaiellales bacterium]|jgi:glutamate-1-semialdehyde 2,1-aminomutase|nr:glutamate-semialdehyde -aminomutase [Gaiellales bacterium]
MSITEHVQIDRGRLGDLLARERDRYAERNPRSKELYDAAGGSLLGGVPMSWMTMWAGGFPLFLDHAEGARVTDADGNEYVDLCLGDTGAMAGHGPAATIEAVERQVRRGITVMLPTQDAIWTGEELTRRFGLGVWQFALTATDANRWVLRMARALTGRPKVLVFNYCYHGTVDETIISIEDGAPRARPGNVGPAVDPTETTRVVEFNDVEALERELAHGDVACVLAEPALTNIGIVLPEPGFHDRLRELTRRTGTLLIIDETHTMSTGPGGYTAAHGLDPDMLTVGKSIAGGIPIGAYGMRRELAERILGADVDLEDVGGVGGTLAGNALSLAAARATLSEVLTDDAYAHMIPLAERFTAGVQDVLDGRRMPWNVVRLGARAEYRFLPRPPRNGGESAAAHDGDLDAYMHVYLMNRGVLITPFHNMALMSPATTEADVDRHTEAFAAAVDDLIGDTA